MSNVLIFPPSDCALEWIDDRHQLVELDAKRTEIQAAMRDVSELRDRAKLGLEDAIAALEQGHARLRQVVQVLEIGPVRTKLHKDIAVLEQLLERAKSGFSKFWLRNP